jgi:hypothetical protein
MNQATAEDMIDKAVNKAIREFAKKQREDNKKKALHNTKLLLKNYDKIKKSVELSIEDLNNEIETMGLDLSNLDRDQLYIDSIRRSKSRSLIIVSHIGNALANIDAELKRNDAYLKYQIFESCILKKEIMIYEAADKYNTSKATVARWISDITNALSIYLFGVEGVNYL